MPADWVTCASCGLKHRQRDDNTCPKCGAALGGGAGYQPPVYESPVYSPPTWQGPVSEQPYAAPAPDPTPQRELASWQMVLLFLFPLGALLTLRSGYSSTARFVSLGWLCIVIVARIGGVGATDALDVRTAWLKGFNEGCVKSAGKISAARCACIGERLYDTIPESDRAEAIDSIKQGATDPRVTAAITACDGR